MLQFRRFAADRCNLGVEQVEHQHRLAVGEREIKLDLALRGQRMDHVRDRPHQVERVEHDDALRRIRHADRDPVVGFDAERTQRLRAGVDLADKLPEGHFRVFKFVGDPVRIRLCIALDELEHRHVRIIEMLRNTEFLIRWIPRCFCSHCFLSVQFV